MRLQLSAVTVVAATLAFFAGCEQRWDGRRSTPVSPTSPSPAVPPLADLSGVWTGQYLETGCQSACCPASCTMRGKGGPRVQDVTIRLVQHGSILTGAYEEPATFGNTPTQGSISGSLAGLNVDLRGTLAWTSTLWADVYGWVDLVEFKADADAEGATLAGTFKLRDRRQNQPDFMTRSARIMTLAKQK